MAEYRTDVLFIKLFIRFFGKNCENKENIVFCINILTPLPTRTARSG